MRQEGAIFSAIVVAVQGKIQAIQLNAPFTYLHCAAETAAALTGYNIQHIRRLAYDGKLEALRVGHAWLISLDSIRRYVRPVTRSGGR